MAHSTNDLNAVRQLLGPAIMYSANTVVFTAFALPFMLRISPRLTLFAFLPLPFASVLVQYFGAKIHTRFERIQAMFSDISAQAEENFSGARLIRAFAQEEAQIAAFETSNREYIRRSLLLARLMAMLWPTLEFVLGVSIMLTLLVGGHEIVNHRITVPQFTTYIVYMVQLTWPMIAIGWVVNLVQRGAASVVRIDKLMKEQPSINDHDANSTASHAVSGEITLQNLSFAYPTGPEVLHDISLAIPAGSSLAIVGPTGSGKSTLVSLIPRLYDAEARSVLIDGLPIGNYPLATLRSAIGFVPQETFLFSTTIADNIAFGDTSEGQHNEREIESAAATAHIAAEIKEFPAGFQTVVGERGMTLSARPKAAHRHRPRYPSRPAHPHPRRRSRQRRHLHRRANPHRLARSHAGPHNDPHRPPRLHCPQRRPHRRARRWPHHRTWYARRTPRPRRILQRPFREAVARRRDTYGAIVPPPPLHAKL